MLAIIALCYRRGQDPIIIDPIDISRNVNAKFDSKWNIVNNGTVDYVGIFKLEMYRKAVDKNAELGNFSVSIANNSHSELKISNSSQIISIGSLLDGKYSTSPFYFLEAYGTHFYDDGSKAAGYIEYYIPNRFGRNIEFEHNESELETMRLEALNSEWPSEEEMEISDANYVAVESGTVDMYSCPFRFYYSLDYDERPKTAYVYPFDLNLEFRDFRDNGDSNMVEIVRLKATLVSDKCATLYEFEGEIANSAKMIEESFVYTLPMIFISILGIITAARLLHLTNSMVRAQRISLYSILLETAYDLVMAFEQLNSAIAVPHIHSHLLIVAANYFIMAAAIDVTLLAEVYFADLAARGEQPNPRTICKILMGSYVAYFVLFFIIEIIPQWGIFLMVTAASSYWFLQSLHAAIRGTPGKPLPLDYILTETLCKYAPIIYFYSIRDNFMEYEILNWYPYVLWIWSGLQFLVILLQYIFGSRIGIKIRQKKDTEIYHYDLELPSARLLQESTAFISVEEIVQAAASSNVDLWEYLLSVNRTFPIPFTVCAPNLTAEETDQLITASGNTTTEEVDEQLTNTCMNPLHKHSLLFKAGITEMQILSAMPSLERNCEGDLNACFYLAPDTDLDEFLICAICIDAVRLDEIPNVEVLELYGTPECPNERELSQLRGMFPRQGDPLYITPCGHCYHMKCIETWASESAQCPVDRQHIPPCGGAVWYE